MRSQNNCLNCIKQLILISKNKTKKQNNKLSHPEQQRLSSTDKIFTITKKKNIYFLTKILNLINIIFCLLSLLLNK